MRRETRLDWAAMLRAGLSGLGLTPQEFWRLSPAELLLMLGETGPGPMQRSAFDALAARFPDIREQETEGDAP
jgi:uncharacterized phage protein (TIGR02216 family)